MSILTLEHCSHSFGGRSIFEDVSFRLLKGEHVGLLGANGEGKSTFMKIITRKLEPEEGKITWSKNVKVGYLDQHAVLEPGMTIHDALAQAFAGLFDIIPCRACGRPRPARALEPARGRRPSGS